MVAPYGKSWWEPSLLHLVSSKGTWAKRRHSAEILVGAAACHHSSRSFQLAVSQRSQPVSRSHSCCHCHQGAGAVGHLLVQLLWQYRWMWCSWGPGLPVSCWSWTHCLEVCRTEKNKPSKLDKLSINCISVEIWKRWDLKTYGLDSNWI